MMIVLNACPRCTGDLHGRDDEYGPYYTCLQCGHSVDQLTVTTSVPVREHDEELAV
jgi:hypothetical protein